MKILKVLLATILVLTILALGSALVSANEVALEDYSDREYTVLVRTDFFGDLGRLENIFEHAYWVLTDPLLYGEGVFYFEDGRWGIKISTFMGSLDDLAYDHGIPATDDIHIRFFSDDGYIEISVLSFK